MNLLWLNSAPIKCLSKSKDDMKKFWVWTKSIFDITQVIEDIIELLK